MDEDHLMNVIEITKLVDLNKQIVEQENEVESDADDVLPEVAHPDTVMEEILKKLYVKNHYGLETKCGVKGR
ncbi:hypothetical protein Tco_1500874 [Tanacetum coccineum]